MAHEKEKSLGEHIGLFPELAWQQSCVCKKCDIKYKIKRQIRTYTLLLISFVQQHYFQAHMTN